MNFVALIASLIELIKKKTKTNSIIFMCKKINNKNEKLFTQLNHKLC